MASGRIGQVVRRGAAILAGTLATTWLALAAGLDSCAAASSIWRYRAVENGSLEMAERIDAAVAAVARAAELLAVPRARTVRASALARLAEVDSMEGEPPEARPDP